MNAGGIDRRVRILTYTVSGNGYGEEIKTPVLHAEVWAKVTPLRGKELFAAQQVVPNAELKIDIRWRSGIVETMRVEHDGVEYGIQHIEEIGRRVGLSLLVSRPE